jgi:3',5'-cyclic AMP phosphodiesterase CpdA
MRFAAIADVHGNYLALEAVVADIRAQGIDGIVNLGDMASGPLDARRTMDALMALDAVHVRGNHDRWLIDRPVEKMGSWERPAYAQPGISTGCARCHQRKYFAIRPFSATRRLRTITSTGLKR